MSAEPALHKVLKAEDGEIKPRKSWASVHRRIKFIERCLAAHASGDPSYRIDIDEYAKLTADLDELRAQVLKGDLE